MSLKRNFRLLLWFNFFTDFKLYAAIAIIYFSDVSHSYALGASIFSITYVSSALFDVPAGIFADRIGRKRSVVIGAVLAVISVIFYAIGINYWILVTGAVFEGIQRAFFSGNNNAFLHDMLAREHLQHQYHRHFGKLSSMFQIALGISGVLGAALAGWSLSVVLWLSVIPKLIALLISIRLTDTERPMYKTHLVRDLIDASHEFVRNFNLRLLSLSSMLGFAVGETQYQFQAAFYNTLLPLWAVGFAKLFSNITSTIGFLISGKIINKIGATDALLSSTLLSRIIGVFSLVVVTKLSPFLISFGSLFYAVGTTASNSLMQKEFSDKQRATMSSLNSFGGSLMLGLLTFIIGVFADNFGPRLAMLILEICAVPIIFLLLILRKNELAMSASENDGKLA